MVTIPFEQAPEHVAAAVPGIPAPELVRSTALFDEFRRPVVRCTLVIRAVRSVTPNDGWDGVGHPLATAIYDSEEFRLELYGEGTLFIAVSEPAAELAVDERPVSWQRVRRGRGLQWESVRRCDPPPNVPERGL